MKATLIVAKKVHTISERVDGSEKSRLRYSWITVVIIILTLSRIAMGRYTCLQSSFHAHI